MDTLTGPVGSLVVVFGRKVPTASGATAVQIAERVGDRDNVIEHIGSAAFAGRAGRPHGLHRQITAGDRRLQTSPTPSFGKWGPLRRSSA